MPKATQPEFTIEYLDPRDLKAHPANFRRHPDSQRIALGESLKEHGYLSAPIMNRRTQTLLDGHARVELAVESEERLIPVRVIDVSEAQEQRILASFDRIGSLADQDDGALAALLQVLAASAEGLPAGWEQGDLDTLLAELGTDEVTTDGADRETARQTLRERFGVPPFSVLDARQGYWQERKRAWIALGIQSELGRGDGTRPGSPGDHRPAVTREGPYDGGDAYRYAGPNRSDHKPSGPIPGGAGANTPYSRQRKASSPGRNSGQDLMRGEHGVGEKSGGLTWTGKAAEFDGYRVENGERETPQTSGTSIFDPVLCELAYRWFCPERGRVLDPFAGGSVRGIVAQVLGRSYVGIDLAAAQIKANREQADAIGVAPEWIAGDSRECVSLVGGGEFDFVFSCPPYADLEVYSDDPRDLSTLPYPEFLAQYRAIIRTAVGRLKENRFACFVVGDVRDPQGFYRNFVSDTIAAFQDAGMLLYNHAILVTAVGSLPIRVGKQFGTYRKLGKTHQDVIIAYRGDPKRIQDIAADCQFGDVGEEKLTDDGAPV
jgi:16S rRNA G966 N2-methylase RsmD